MSKSSNTAVKAPAGRLAALVLVAFATSILATFQWMELLIAHAGGELSCAINATFDCSAVWRSGFARGVHRMTSMPVAGWGLVWGLAASLASVRLWWSVTTGSERERVDTHVVRLLGVVGIITSVVLGGVSVSLGAFCVTCIATYWLVFGFALLTFGLPQPLRPEGDQLLRAGGLTAAWTGAVFVALLYPGRATPSSDALSLANVAPAIAAAPAAAPAPTTQPPPARDSAGHNAAGHNAAAHSPQVPRTLDSFIDAIRPAGLQRLSDSIARAKAGKVRDTKRWATRYRWGPADAPSKMVEFTDILCGHCATFTAELHQLEKLIPKGSLSVEPRQYPLDAACNPTMPKNMIDRTGTRCAAAQVLICLEGQDAFWTVQQKLFESAHGIDRAGVVAIAGMSTDRQALEACMQSPETARKLADDIAYANEYELQGTPLVLLNGREVEPAGALLYALILAGGDPTAAPFNRLPPPRPDALLDPHAGHNH